MDDRELARRALVASGWWMPGMLATGPGWFDTARVVAVDPYGDPNLWMYRGYSRGPCTSHSPGDETPWSEASAGALPDLDDPATRGCLLALVRERWGVPGLGVHFDALAGLWVFADPLSLPEGLRRIAVATEAEALVAALEAPVGVRVTR